MPQVPTPPRDPRKPKAKPREDRYGVGALGVDDQLMQLILDELLPTFQGMTPPEPFDPQRAFEQLHRNPHLIRRMQMQADTTEAPKYIDIAGTIQRSVDADRAKEAGLLRALPSPKPRR